MTEDEMVGWHHQLNGREFEQAPGVGDGQGSLVRCSPWGHKELDMTEQLNNNIHKKRSHRSEKSMHRNQRKPSTVKNKNKQTSKYIKAESFIESQKVWVPVLALPLTL